MTRKAQRYEKDLNYLEVSSQRAYNQATITTLFKPITNYGTLKNWSI